MTPKLKGTSPLFKKCALDTVTSHLNPFRATFLFKKAPTNVPNVSERVQAVFPWSVLYASGQGRVDSWDINAQGDATLDKFVSSLYTPSLAPRDKK